MVQQWLTCAHHHCTACASLSRYEKIALTCQVTSSVSASLQAAEQLQYFRPRNLAQLIWAAATLQAQLPSTFPAAFLAASGSQLPWFQPIDIANTLWGLATLGVKPQPQWLHAARQAAGLCWSRFKPFELSISVWSLAKLGAYFGDLGSWSHPQQQQQQHAQLQPQQQQQQQQQGPSVPAAVSDIHRGADARDTGFGWLFSSMALLSPAMGVQEIANLLWGLAVGRATLSSQQVQVCAGPPTLLCQFWGIAMQLMMSNHRI
jgi:hypothetical protein